MAKNVVLVDKNDNELGLMDKYEAHENTGTLHRAISVVLYRNVEGGREILIQRRSKRKLLWPEYWDSTCSTHPWENELYEKCSVRRLREEMGINIDKDGLEVVDKLYYKADYSDQLSEHELDAILVCKYNEDYSLNEDEVSEAKWVSVNWLEQDMGDNPNIYAPWFLLIIPILSVKWESVK